MSQNNTGSVQTGSPLIGGPSDANVLPASGQPQVQGEFVPKAQYDELFTKMGQMGNENGEFRQFFNDLTPLLEKLDKSPELARAFLDEKFNEDLAKAILDGRVTVKEAQAVAAATENVQQQLGQPAFNATSSEDLAKLVEKEMAKLRTELEQKDELRSFEQRTADFIANTPDFADYGDKISKWLDDHADVTDVETAYFAVKGKLSAEEAAKVAGNAQAELAKEMAQNASGGGSSATYVRRESNIVDQLIAGRSNPNVF